MLLSRGPTRSASMQRIVTSIEVEASENNSNSHYINSHLLDNLGSFDSDDESTTSESRHSVVSTVPSEDNRAGTSDKKLIGTLVRRASSRVDANKILEKFGQDYIETLPEELQQKTSAVGIDSVEYHSPTKRQRFTGAELGSIQDVLVRYESKAYDLLASGRHDRALQTCQQLRALIRQLAAEGIVDHHGSVAGAGCANESTSSTDSSTTLLQLYAMAVESEALFLNGKLKRAKKRLMQMDHALAELASSSDKPLSQLPRAVRCAVACYTMLGNLFSLEARRMKVQSNQLRFEQTTQQRMSQHSFLVSSHHSFNSSHPVHQSSQHLSNKQEYDEEAYNATLDLSVEAFQHAVKLRKEEGGNPGFGHTLLGEVLVVQGNFVEATAQFESALACALRFENDAAVQERRNLGDAFLIRNNYAQALGQYTACVRNIAFHLDSLSVGSPHWNVEMLAQAAVCCTISTCLRALGQLDQAHVILDEAERMVLESGAMNNPNHVLQGTDSRIHLLSSSRSFSNDRGKSFMFKSSTPSKRDLHEKAGNAAHTQRSKPEQESARRRVRRSTTNTGVTTGEASLELLVRISVEKGHLHIRNGDWKMALKCYQNAENRLDYTDPADDGVHLLDPTRSIALRGTIIMFLGDVFAYRISKLMENGDDNGNQEENGWRFNYDEKGEGEGGGGKEQKEQKERDGEEKSKRDDGENFTPDKEQVTRYNGNDLYASAMNCYEQSHCMACDVTDESDPYRIICLARVGQLHSLCRAWDKALPVLQHCLQQTQDIAVIHRQLRAGLSVAVADGLRHGGDVQQHNAIQLYNNALQLYHNSAGANCAEMGAAYFGIGKIWTSRGDHASALRVSGNIFLELLGVMSFD